MSVNEYIDESSLIRILKFKTLKAELEEIHDDNLKMLRPKRNKNYTTGT